MAFLIWLIVIIAIIVSTVNKQKQQNTRNGQKQGWSASAGAWQQRTAQYSAQRANMQSRTASDSMRRNTVGGQTGNAGWTAATSKQRELKEKLLQRYGQPGDILSRANANVRENDGDQLRREMAGSAGTNTVWTDAQVMTDTTGRVREACALTGAADLWDTSELMDTVSDLIVTGYHPKLTFERDFVSEGLEMLNRYEIPDTLQG